MELRKLISGTQHRAKYRLVAAAHPDGPPPKKGAPPKKETIKPTRTDLRLSRAFERAKAKHGNITAATAQVMADEKVSKDMVGRARASVRKYTEFVEVLKAARRDANKRADAALAKLRLDSEGK